MKRILFILALSLTFSVVYHTDAQAQSARKELREQEKAAKDKDESLVAAIKDNAVRDARKEARELEKLGYVAATGALPLEKQIENAWKLQYELGEDGYPLYYISTQTTIGGNYSAAKTQATALAKNDIAGLISSEISSVIQTNVSNEVLSQDDAVSMISMISSSKQKISQTLGRTISVVEISRVEPNNRVELRLTLAYNSKNAMEMIKQLVVTELKAKSEKLAQQLDEIL